MSKQTFSVDDTLYRAQAKKLVKKLKLDEEQFIKDQAGMFAQTLCKVVPPFKGSPKLSGKGYGGNLASGKRAILSDMKTMFRIREIGYLQFLADVTGKRRNIRQTLRTKTGRTYIVDVDYINWSSIDEAMDFHEKQQRPSSGRAKHSGKGGKDPRIGRWTARDRMWITEEIWNKVRLTLWRRVGIAKSSLAKVAVKLGRPNPPKWILKHFDYVYAPITITKNPTTVSFKVYEKGLEPAFRRMKEVERFRMVAMIKRLEALVKADVKKAGFETK